MTIDLLHSCESEHYSTLYKGKQMKCKICNATGTFRFSDVCGSHVCRQAAGVCDCYACDQQRRKQWSRKCGCQKCQQWLKEHNAKLSIL